MAPIERPDWGGALAPAGGNELDIADDGGMLADLDAGFRSPEVESRYRAMVAGRMERHRLSAEGARASLPSGLVAEWERSGGVVEIRLAEAQKAAIGILEGLHADDRVEFVQGFDALPDGVRSAIFLELSLGSAGSVRNASDADVARFAEMDEGRELVAEWRGRASRNVAIVLGRIRRIAERLSVADATLLDEWFNALPSRSTLAVLRVLAAR